MHILIFPDGETFNSLEGCHIARVPDGLEIEDVEQLIKDDKETTLHVFAGDEDTGSYKIEVPESVERMDGFELRVEAETIIAEDKVDRQTLAEIVAQFGDNED